MTLLVGIGCVFSLFVLLIVAVVVALSVSDLASDVWEEQRQRRENDCHGVE